MHSNLIQHFLSGYLQLYDSLLDMNLYKKADREILSKKSKKLIAKGGSMLFSIFTT
jgi:hypothetical protein